MGNTLNGIIEFVSENILSVITAVTAIISVWISLRTLRQNSKMIEESSRPYITAQIEHIGNAFYLRFKNYGQSAAIIDNIELDENAEKVQVENFITVFEDFRGNTIPPNYSFMTCIRQDNVSDEENKISIGIKYHSAVKKYTEHVEINLAAYKKLLEARRIIDKNNPEVAIGQILQDLVFAVEKHQ